MEYQFEPIGHQANQKNRKNGRHTKRDSTYIKTGWEPKEGRTHKDTS